MKILIFFLFLKNIFSLETSAAFDLYEPGIFHPLGPTLLYGNSDIRKRPYMVLAINEKDQIVEKSLLQYDNQGRLIAEKIFNPNNQFKGEIQYIYNNNKIIEERYTDSNLNVFAKKIRKYIKEELVQIDFYDNENLQFSRTYKYNRNLIIGREFQKGFSDPFIIKLKNGLIESVEFKDKNNTLMVIHYKYEGSKLIERNKLVGEVQSRCSYFYDSENRLKEYVYFDLIRKQWKKTKTIRFVYADQI